MGYDHDERLDLLRRGQYRIWHDGQNILIPKGQSTTQPLEVELVGTNTRVYGEINKSFFKKPLVDFTNTHVYTERFDKYFLSIWRDGDQLPNENVLIDYKEDMGLTRIHAYLATTFSCDHFGEVFTGYFEGHVVFRHIKDAIWITDLKHFKADANTFKSLEGDFFLGCNLTTGQKIRGGYFTTSEFIQETNLPIEIVMPKASIKNGNSCMPLIVVNHTIRLHLIEFKIGILGAE